MKVPELKGFLSRGVPIEGDGPCIFNALSITIFEPENNSLQVREYILTAYSQYCSFEIRRHYHGAANIDEKGTYELTCV